MKRQLATDTRVVAALEAWWKLDWWAREATCVQCREVVLVPRNGSRFECETHGWEEA